MGRAVLLAQGDVVQTAGLGRRIAPEAAPRMEEMSLDDVERLLIQKALARYEGNVSHAAKSLGLSRSGLYRRIQKFGL